MTGSWHLMWIAVITVATVIISSTFTENPIVPSPTREAQLALQDRGQQAMACGHIRPSTCFVNKALLEPTHAHSFMSCPLWLSLPGRQSRAVTTETTARSPRCAHSGPFWKTLPTWSRVYGQEGKRECSISDRSQEAFISLSSLLPAPSNFHSLQQREEPAHAPTISCPFPSPSTCLSRPTTECRLPMVLTSGERSGDGSTVGNMEGGAYLFTQVFHSTLRGNSGKAMSSQTLGHHRSRLISLPSFLSVTQGKWGSQTTHFPGWSQN